MPDSLILRARENRIYTYRIISFFTGGRGLPVKKRRFHAENGSIRSVTDPFFRIYPEELSPSIVARNIYDPANDIPPAVLPGLVPCQRSEKAASAPRTLTARHCIAAALGHRLKCPGRWQYSLYRSEAGHSQRYRARAMSAQSSPPRTTPVSSQPTSKQTHLYSQYLTIYQSFLQQIAINSELK